MDVDRALRPAGGARGVDDHVGRLGITIRGAARWRVPRRRPPDIATLGPGNVECVPGARDDDDPFDRRRLGHRGVRHPLQVDPAPASKEPIGGDKQPGVAIGEARSDGWGPVAREDRREDRPESTDREDGDDGLRQHRQEDPDTVACLDPEAPQLLGRTPDATCELTVRQLGDRSVLTLPRDGDAVRVADCAWFDCRPRPVERAADPPSRPRRAAGEVGDVPRASLPGDTDVIDGRAPEPRRICDRTGLEGVERRLAGRSPEARQARLSGQCRIGSPGDVGSVATEDRPVVPARSPHAESLRCDLAMERVQGRVQHRVAPGQDVGPRRLDRDVGLDLESIVAGRHFVIVP